VSKSVEERLSDLEAEVAELKAREGGRRYGVVGRSNPRLIRQMIGTFADSPLHANVVRHIEENRERERREAEREADEAPAT
jgi:hypothetical protein